VSHNLCDFRVTFVTPGAALFRITKGGALMTKAASKKPGGKGDNPPIFSHEFVRKNHGDILSIACMVVFVMMMFQVVKCCVPNNAHLSVLAGHK